MYFVLDHRLTGLSVELFTCKYDSKHNHQPSGCNIFTVKTKLQLDYEKIHQGVNSTHETFIYPQASSQILKLNAYKHKIKSSIDRARHEYRSSDITRMISHIKLISC